MEVQGQEGIKKFTERNAQEGEQFPSILESSETKLFGLLTVHSHPFPFYIISAYIPRAKRSDDGSKGDDIEEMIESGQISKGRVQKRYEAFDTLDLQYQVPLILVNRAETTEQGKLSTATRKEEDFHS